ncbi:MAG: hypothetical protein U0X87_13905 [Anaerolineales bacterium]
MTKRLRVFTAIIILALSLLACGVPSNGADSPTSAIEPTSSGDQVATVVASTMQALTPSSPDSPTPQPTGLLPHSLYFINNDNAGIAQVFRLEADGKTTTQITFEPSAVNSYDVSQVDGSVVYVSNNQLLLINPDGSGRRMLIDGGAIDENNPFVSRLSNPVFSPNAQTIAYGYKGLNLYAVASGVNNLVIENIIKDSGNGFFFPEELYAPNKYSPDGTKLLITLGYYEGASSAIYYPAANSLVRLTNDAGAHICCDEVSWTPDSSTLYSASSTIGMIQSGMWRVDASNGLVTTLLASNYETSVYLYAYEPYLAPDGQLYFFFHTANTEFNARTPLQIVRSSPNDVANRTVLLPETFQLMNEALWAPDASFVITAIAPSDQIYQGGSLELFYTHAEAGFLTLAPFGQQLKWGP